MFQKGQRVPTYNHIYERGKEDIPLLKQTLLNISINYINSSFLIDVAYEVLFLL